MDKVSDVLSLTEVTYLKKGFGLPKGVGEEQRGDLHVSLDPQWENTPPTVWEHFLQVSLKALGRTCRVCVLSLSDLA